VGPRRQQTSDWGHVTSKTEQPCAHSAHCATWMERQNDSEKNSMPCKGPPCKTPCCKPALLVLLIR